MYLGMSKVWTGKKVVVLLLCPDFWFPSERDPSNVNVWLFPCRVIGEEQVLQSFACITPYSMSVTSLTSKRLCSFCSFFSLRVLCPSISVVALYLTGAWIYLCLVATLRSPWGWGHWWYCWLKGAHGDGDIGGIVDLKGPMGLGTLVVLLT